MKLLIKTVLLVAFIHGSSTAQNRKADPCPLLIILLKQADNFEARKEFIKSLNKLYSARVAARNCKDGDVNKVDDQIAKVNNKIIDLKTEADAARSVAIIERKIAVNERNKAQQAERAAKSAAERAEKSASEALEAKNKADRAAQKADSSARITEASRLTTLAMQVKEDDPTLALQLIKKACDTSYFNYRYAVEMLHAILAATPPASYYLKKIENEDADFSSAAMADKGQYLIAGSYSGSISVWNIAKTAEPGVGKPAAFVAGHKGAVLSLAASPDGEIVVSGGIDGAVYRWDSTLKNPPVSLAMPADTSAVLSLAISADKRFLVGSGENKVVNVWNLTTGMLEKKLPLLYGNAIQVCFSPDGKYIGMAGNDETVRVWDWQPGNIIATLEGHLGAVRSVAFSADGNYIVSGGDDKTVKVWDWKKSAIIHTLQGHLGPVMSVAFSSDQAYVVSASQDNTIKVWDLRNNRVYRELRGHQKPVFAAGFYGDDRHIYSGSYDRTVKLWDWQQDYMVNPPVNTRNQQKGQFPKNNLAFTKKDFAQSDTTLFSHYVVTQGSDKTIWLWDSTSTSKPLFIVYDQDNHDQDTNNSLQVSPDIAVINSRELYQDFYQKIARTNGKLIPVMTHKDRSGFFSNSQ